MKTAQQLLEDWWNEGNNSENRWAEIMCGENLRMCVRLYDVLTDKSHNYKISEFEAGTLEEAISGAIAAAKKAEKGER